MIKFKPKKNISVLIIQQFNRAYRIPLLKKIAEHPDITLTMIHGTNAPVQAGDIGISLSNEVLPFRTIKKPISGIRCSGREILWFGHALHLLKKESFDVVICDYYTRLLSIWPMQGIQYKRKAGFILWGIGFHQHPTPLINIIRKRMVKRTDALLLYSEKEKQQYLKMGVPAQKCFVTQNTVDIEGIDAGVAAVSDHQVHECRKLIGATNGPVLMHIGRLAANKRIDMIIKALPSLIKKWTEIHLVLIGEGPELMSLRNLSDELGLSARVHFLGPITDHKLLAPWVLASDLFVAPAQIGLMAPMCLVYGRTLVISDLPEHHGPEVQAFLPGETGLNYKYGDSDDLIKAINSLLENPEKRRQFAAVGGDRVRSLMGPEQMLDAFIDSIHFVAEKYST